MFASKCLSYASASQFIYKMLVLDTNVHDLDVIADPFFKKYDINIILLIDATLLDPAIKSRDDKGVLSSTKSGW
jgi:hypothetical protein